MHSEIILRFQKDVQFSLLSAGMPRSAQHDAVRQNTYFKNSPDVLAGIEYSQKEPSWVFMVFRDNLSSLRIHVEGRAVTMSISDFEGTFLERLEHILAERHPTLQLEVPSSGAYSGVPTPDFVIHNPSTGARLAGELKGGLQAEHMPFSTLPYLRSLREHIGFENGDVVLITTGSVPGLVRDGLTRDGIQFMQVASPEEATDQLEHRLAELEKA